MKYTVLPLALVISMASVAEDGWVAVGQAPTVKPATQPAKAATNGVVNSSVTSPAPTTASSNTSLQLELLTMVETMQQEIAELRGTVEVQAHTIETLQKQQQQRYLDLDRRMSELLTTAPAVNSAASSANNKVATSDDTVSVLPADDLYASAMAAIKKKDFASALNQLDTFAQNYPQHSLAANALYWSGEVQLAESNFDVAIKQFSSVINNHPKHSKAADSHYKLGVAYDRSGKTDKAKETLQTVVNLYPGVSDSAVRLAQRYLKRLESTQ